MNGRGVDLPDGDELTDRPKAPLWLLGLLTFSGTLAMHIFVPALPEAATDLGVGVGTMQMTISLYILGLAFGQLFYGPVSDRFGRRPVVMAGLALFAISGLVAALAPGADTLIGARLFQAFGGCAGLVIGRAIVRDTAGPQESAKRLALLNLMVTVGPTVAPVVGGALASTLGWRSILFLLSAFGALNLLCAWWLLPETRGVGAVATGTSIARHYRRLIKSGRFLGYAIGGACATTSIYAFVATAPFIFAGPLHRPIHEVGIYLAVVVSGVWIGSVLASRLIGRVTINRLVVWSTVISVVAAFAFLAVVLAGQMTVPLVVGIMFVFTIGVGTAAPAALAQAISVDAQVIGSASGLYGFAQMIVGALCTTLVGIGNDPALAAALVLAGTGVISQLAFWLADRRP